MNILTLDNITKSYGDRHLLKNCFFALNEGEKVGILGINGTGKSTLLKIMSGLEEPDEGSVTKANHVIIRYLPQHPVFDEGETVLESVMKNNKTKENEWTLEAEAKTMLNELGITNFSAEVNTLSGGQRKRIALAAVLLSPADILILDEPTNHLDSEMADWLENFLKKWKGGLIMVTHDRYFLDSVSNRIVEIDKGSIYSYQTNYSGFLQLKAEREESAIASERKRQSILRVELAWMLRGARARSTKQKAHIQRYENLKSQEAPIFDSKVEISSVSSRLGRTTVELDGVSKSYGDKKLIDNFTYVFLKDDRIGFIGPNGCGKTTLMKMIAGIIKPDEGQVIVGQTVKIGYYSQEIQTEILENMSETAKIAVMTPEKRVIDYIRDTAEYVRTEDGLVSASQMLEQFLFPSEKQYTPIGKLSGGEKRRLNLLRVLMEAPNVLILDEPTNDLDVQTLTILEDYLDHFKGIVITVSHDRYFLDRIVRRIFAFEGDGVLTQYEGGFTDYSIAKKERELVSLEPVKTVRAEPKKMNVREHEKKLKFTWKEQKEFETIEDDIAALEEKLEDLERLMGQSATDFVRLNQLIAEKETAEQALEEKMERWEYLTELDEKIKQASSRE
ncbi:MAG: ABC-F family ATP-binding cassette domain-containing protein [Lachnospiraceae bacterium]